MEQMTKAVTKSQVFLARLVIALIVAFVLGGLLWYGVSADERARLLTKIFFIALRSHRG